MNQSQRSQRHPFTQLDESWLNGRENASNTHLPTCKTHATTLTTSNTFRNNKENELNIDLTKSSQLSLAKPDNLRRIQISLKSSASSVGLGLDKSLLDRSNIINLGTSSLTLSKSNIHEELQIKTKALSNHYTMLYEIFKREFQSSMKSLDHPKSVSIETMIQVLNTMGYLQQPIINQQDLKLIRMAHHLLNGRANHNVKSQNFFTFLLIVSRVEIPSPFNNYDDGQRDQMGRIDIEGNIYFSASEQLKIREIYKKLWENRVTNRQQKKTSNQYAVSFKEALREYQVDLSKIHQNKEERLSIEETHKSKKIRSKEKIIQEERRKKSEELKNCTFKPKIIRDAKMTDREGTDRCQQLFNLARKRTLSNLNGARMSTSEERQRKELEQCTFKPKQTPFRLSIRTPTVKNSEKAIKRLAEGRTRRQNATTLLERGYPKDVCWTKFLQSCKQSKNQSSHATRRNSPRKPIITIDIRLCQTTQQALEVFEGDSLQNITCKVLVKHRLHYEYYSKLVRLIADALKDAQAVVVKDGFVYSAL